MRTMILRFALRSPLVLSSSCLLLTGCDSKPTVSDANSAVAPAAPQAAAPGELPAMQASAIPAAPRVASGPVGVQTSYVAPAADQGSASPSASRSGGIPDNVEEPVFVPYIEDLQLFEQPDLSSYSKTPPPGGWYGGGPGLNITVPVSKNPLPESSRTGRVSEK